MERSEEIEGVIRAMFDMMASGDGAAFDDMLSRQPGVLFLGTDATEWCEGYDTVERDPGAAQ